jgi:prevent-host-death family protein
MRVITIREAKSNLSKLVELAAAGEEILVVKAGEPVARLIAYENAPAPKRKPGAWKGKVWIGPDFDTLPPDLHVAFNGETPRPVYRAFKPPQLSRPGEQPRFRYNARNLFYRTSDCL